jgi:very-short-patch-repair endonuclease
MKKNGLISTGYHIAYNPKLKERARELRKNMTSAEKKLWDNYLKNFFYPVLRQKPLDNYIVDFYCPTLKLVIEIDGDIHNTKDAFEYDKLRTEVLAGYGLRVIRFSNDDVLNKFCYVCKQINLEINPTVHCKIKVEYTPFI